ncbi:MAG: hypothetical protein Q9Q40_01310 [Acidobacteriota bacterium]|nr:hypothetical protein [Acidobacteriota bacterium]
MRRGWLRGGLCAALLLFVPALAAAQSARIVRPIRVHLGEGYLDFGYHLERASRRPGQSGLVSEQVESTWLGGVSADLEGSFLHPSLLPFSLGGTLRVRRSDVDETAGRLAGRQDTNDSDYRFRLGLLPGFRWSGEIVATSFVQELDSSFAPARLVRRRGEVLSIRRKSRSWPLRFHWRRSRNWGIKGDPRDERKNDLGFRVDHRGKTGRVSLLAERLDYSEIAARQDYVTHRMSAGLSYRPGGTNKVQLATNFYGYDRTGTSTSRYLLGSGSVAVQPLPDLRLNALFEYQSQEEDIGKRVSKKGKFQGSHLLWGSLATRVYALLENQALPLDGSLDVREAVLTFDYTRHLEAGALMLGWSRGRRAEEEALPTGERPITEDQTYELGFPILLAHPDVVPGSVSVTDATGTIVYVENMDYEVVERDGVTEIVVVPAGDIVPGQALRINYLVTSVPDLSTVAISRRVSAAWRGTRGLWLRGSRFQKDNRQLSGLSDARLEDLVDTEVRAGYDGRRWGVRGAWRDRQSNILSYASKQFGANWQVLRGRALSVNLRGQIRRTTYPDRVDDTRSRLFGTDVRLQYGRLRVDLGLERWNEVILGRHGRYLQGRLVGRWQLRAVELRLLWYVRYQDVELSGVDDRDEVQIVMRRRFR